jgi:hypothetical protein
MPTLLFEIWQNSEDNSFEMSAVSERGDELRRQIAPRSTRVHSFLAESDFEAFQKNCDWHDWAMWQPPPDLHEWRFSQAEASEQQIYLATRKVVQPK